MRWLLPLYLLAVLVCPPAGYVWLWRRVRQGTLSRGGALGLYAGLSMSPVVGYVTLLLLAVSLEEILQVPLISEGIGRTFFLACGFGIAVAAAATSLFAVALVLSRSGAAGGDRRAP